MRLISAFSLVFLFISGCASLGFKSKQNGALHEACEHGSLSLVTYLVEHGADVEAKDYRSWTPLFIATVYDYPLIVAYLLEEGADIDAKNGEGWTPLMQAAFDGNESLVRLFLTLGADLSLKNSKAESALDMARAKKNNHIVHLLSKSKR